MEKLDRASVNLCACQKRGCGAAEPSRWARSVAFDRKRVHRQLFTLRPPSSKLSGIQPRTLCELVGLSTTTSTIKRLERRFTFFIGALWKQGDDAILAVVS